MNAVPRWLSILGIGEDGVDGLSARAAKLIGEADLVVGGKRHLALVKPLIRNEIMPWPNPIRDALPAILARRPGPVAVLASGDPFSFGVGTLLAARVPADEFLCLPTPSAFSLACARLGWAMQDLSTISFCGRPIAALLPLLQTGTRVLALSADATTAATVADLLRARGFGASRVIVLEALGGPRERIRVATADGFSLTDIDPLNMLAIEIIAGPDARVIPLCAGLDDASFEHDGQITKKEIRAMTLAALAPCRGDLLWDIGSGSGSVAIEFLLRHPSCRAIAFERVAERAARAVRNAACLGVPGLRMVEGIAPRCLTGLPAPDAVFIGGGAQQPGTIDSAWSALQPGGRMVVNAVTIETEAVLLEAVGRLGGTLTRLGVERLDRIGSLHGFRPAMTVTQWVVRKP
ncbi:MAG TPA: precorrin-6y C5,15-methyltransferase (decarboxylating) subunit CbiE [Acetobacteraceae bacterium]|jgi:precorrin-6Y C5,15-methyltransferase (decarboxylating)